MTTAKGYSSSCPAGAVPFGVTALVQAWANNGYNPGNFELRAPNEAANVQWKKFNNNPTLSVTYNSYPGSPAGRSITPGSTTAPPVTNSLTPRLSGATTDRDGNSLRYDYEVWAGTSPTPTTRVTYGSTAYLASGAASSWTVPAGRLANGSSYEYRVRAFDGTDYGAWSAGFAVFSVDTTAPAAPAVSSTSWPANGWAGATSGSLSWTEASTDVVSYLYGLDTPAPGTATTATAVTVTPRPAGIPSSSGPRTGPATCPR